MFQRWLALDKVGPCSLQSEEPGRGAWKLSGTSQSLLLMRLKMRVPLGALAQSRDTQVSGDSLCVARVLTSSPGQLASAWPQPRA